MCLKCNNNKKMAKKAWCKQCDKILEAKARVNSFSIVHDL